MKNKLREFGRDGWRVLTEVPGWPDAPRRLRVRRLIPVVVPVAAMASLFLWNSLWVQPRIQAVKTAHQPLLALEQEVADLRFVSSDSKAAEVAARAAEMTHSLLSTPAQLTPILDEFTRAATNRGWVAVFHPQPVPTTTPAADEPMIFVTARGKLTPTTGNTQPFATLLVLLEQFSPPERSIDLTRLSIRADEQGRQTAEVYLRAGCRLPDEKTAQ